MRLDLYYSFIFLNLSLGNLLCTTYCIESFGYVNKVKLLKSPKLTTEFVNSQAFKAYQLDLFNFKYFFLIPSLKNFNNRLISSKSVLLEKKNILNLNLELDFLKNLFINSKYIPVITVYISNLFLYQTQSKVLIQLYKKFYKYLIICILIRFKFLFFKLLQLRLHLLMAQMLKLIIS